MFKNNCNTSKKFYKENIEKPKLNETCFQGEDVPDQTGCDCDGTLKEILKKIASKSEQFLIEHKFYVNNSSL